MNHISIIYVLRLCWQAVNSWRYNEAATYDVAPIGVADGGAYNSWNAWYVWYPDAYQCHASGNNCTYGWLNYYHIYSLEFGEIFTSDGVLIYETSSLALASAVSTSFTLTSAAYVDFYIRDGVNGDLASDNGGGMSLNINPPSNVPEPAAFWLFITGLLGFLKFGKNKAYT